MINKKANFSTFINQAFVIAALGAIIFFIVGGSGGFKALSQIGATLAVIPGWAYIAIAVIYLFSAMRGK